MDNKKQPRKFSDFCDIVVVKPDNNGKAETTKLSANETDKIMNEGMAKHG